MLNKDYENFYHSLHPLERDIWHKLHDLFQLVEAARPEKGIRVLILRARKLAATQGLPLETALTETLAGATERTHRRMALLNQCTLKGSASTSPKSGALHREE
jgi:hypothetical protein